MIIRDVVSGSGKTFTMSGTETDMGIIPRAIDAILSEFEHNASVWESSLCISMFEIYNNEMFDLIDRSKKPKISSGFAIENLAKIKASNKQDLMELWSSAMKNRSTAPTIGNVCSSRSHAIIQLHIETKSVEQDTSRTAVINMVDLAGSESARNSSNIEETKAINSSLSALMSVVSGLKKKLNTVDYSQCVLTKVLKPSLTGQSKMLLIANLSTSAENLKSTLNTTRFSGAMSHVNN